MEGPEGGILAGAALLLGSLVTLWKSRREARREDGGVEVARDEALLSALAALRSDIEHMQDQHERSRERMAAEIEHALKRAEAIQIELDASIVEHRAKDERIHELEAVNRQLLTDNRRWQSDYANAIAENHDLRNRIGQIGQRRSDDAA